MREREIDREKKRDRERELDNSKINDTYQTVFIDWDWPIGRAAAIREVDVQ